MKDFQKGVLFASTTALLWGFLAIGLKVALNFSDPYTVAWIRFAVAFILLFIYHLYCNRSKLLIIVKPPLLLIIAAFSLGLNYFGFIMGLHLTSPSISQIFIQVGPILLAISGFILFKEQINIRNITGIILVVVGFLLFYYEKLKFFSFNTANYNQGVIWVLIGAIAWAIYAVFQKQLVKVYSPISLNLVLFLIPSLLLFPFIDLNSLINLQLWKYILLFLLGVNTLIAYSCLALALKYIEANKVSVIITLNPIITLIAMAFLSYLNVKWIEHENFTLLIILGAFLIISGAILTTKKISK